jgi:hypothetical protein
MATNAPDTTADAPTDMTAAEAPNTTAKTTDVAAAKAAAASSAASATTTATGIGCNGEKGNGEEQHRGNADAGHQLRPRILRSYGQRLSREQVSVSSRTESF